MKNANAHTLLTLFCAALVACQGEMQSTKKDDEIDSTQSSDPVAVTAALVKKASLNRQIHASGVASGIRETFVVAETRGTITEVNFSLGQYVHQGKVLVAVDDDVQRVAYAQAEKAVEAATLNLEVTRRLYEAGSASEAEMTGAQSQAAAASTQLESSKQAYENCRITAPISGYIAQKDKAIEKGSFLAAGTPVARIVDISSLKTEIPVGEMEVGMLRKGLNAEISVPAAGNAAFKGTVRAIAAGSDPSTGSYPVEVVWRNDAQRRVKSGMSVRVTIHTPGIDSVIMVPAHVIIEKEYKTAVFVSVQGKATIRFVETGRLMEDSIEIESGLGVGDTLITSAMTTIGRGDPVAVTLAGESGDAQ
jgi:membrane fusion protein (multidrug efflux system)